MNPLPAVLLLAALLDILRPEPVRWDACLAVFQDKHGCTALLCHAAMSLFAASLRSARAEILDSSKQLLDVLLPGPLRVRHTRSLVALIEVHAMGHGQLYGLGIVTFAG